MVDVKVTSAFPTLKRFIKPDKPLSNQTPDKHYTSYIAYGNQLRRFFQDDSILAVTSVIRVIQNRNRLVLKSQADRYSSTAYIISQFKRKEEIDLLRSIYGPLFFQISVYSRRGARVAYLSKKFLEGNHVSDPNSFRGRAEDIIQQDYNESDEEHGQRVGSIFHDADVIINLDSSEHTAEDQTKRFCQLIFGSNSISPSRAEYGMFAAKAAALRSLDLARQVGAAIFSAKGEVISLGSNEVPKALGGTYWSDDPFDARDYRLGHDSNEQRRRAILLEIAKAFGVEGTIDELLKNPKVKQSQLMDSLEYGRAVHAEMSALCDAARLGRSVEGGVLYCTTFPCHICAKHIVDAGIAKVIFLEPYAKSRASSLHPDSIQIEGEDRGQYDQLPAVKFEHFSGVSPRRYRELFERNRRKDNEGNYVGYVGGTPQPIVEITSPSYVRSEELVVDQVARVFMERLARDHTILDEVETP